MASTAARLGIDITATDRTKAAFASTQRSLDNMNRSVGIMKNALAGLAGGNIVAGFTRSMISINREVPAVKQAFEGLNASYTKFAQAVGAAGLNQALINFSTRVGGMIAGTDGLATSIGHLLGSGVNGLAYLFEGIGRSVAFVSDNINIFLRSAGVFVAFKLGQQVAWTGLAFLKFAQAIRSTTTLMGVFSVVTSIGKRGLIGLGIAAALIATNFEEVQKYVDSLTKSIADAMGPLGATVRKTLQALGFDTSALNVELAGMVAFGPGIENTGKAFRFAGRSAKILDGNLKELKETAADQAFDSIKQSLNSLSGSLVQVVQGTTTLKEAFSSTITSLIQDLTRLFVNQAFQAFLGMFGSSAIAAIAPGVGPGSMGFTHFGGPRAAGGPVQRGKAYLVGEDGPELFAPGANGSIIPGRSGGSGNVVVNVSNPPGMHTERRERKEGGRTVVDLINTMFDKRLASQSTDKFMNGRYGITPRVTSR